MKTKEIDNMIYDLIDEGCTYACEIVNNISKEEALKNGKKIN